MIRVLGYTVLALCLLVPTAAKADCIFNRYSFQFGTAPVGPVIVSATQGSCDAMFTGGLRVTYSSLRLVSPPRSGSFRVHQSGLGFIYTPRPGYAGPDAFSVEVCGTAATSKGCTRINYAVDVK
jgi:hypothetical protein